MIYKKNFEKDFAKNTSQQIKYVCRNSQQKSVNFFFFWSISNFARLSVTILYNSGRRRPSLKKLAKQPTRQNDNKQPMLTSTVLSTHQQIFTQPLSEKFCMPQMTRRKANTIYL